MYMAKKCTPGVNCADNTSLLLFGIMFLVMGYLVYQVHSLGTTQEKPRQMESTVSLPLTPPTMDVSQDPGRCGANGRTLGDPLTNPYVPPVRCDAGGVVKGPMTMTMPQNSVPINVPTQHYNTQYSQVGILTKNNRDIFPLMGRRTVTARNKWQYYTVSGGGAGGNLQTKLPIKVKNRNCSAEYGCDEIYNNDDVYVEGFNDIFKATIYDSGLFSYLPF